MILSSLELTCAACPSQWEGLSEDGRPVYIRYRWGLLVARVADPGHDPVFGHEFYSKDIGGALDGAMSTEEMLKWTGLSVLPVDKVVAERWTT